MALFSLRHSVKTFSVKRTSESREAKDGQTWSHIKYISRTSAARVFITEGIELKDLRNICAEAEASAKMRKGRVCERIIVALPVEATLEQREELTRNLCEVLSKKLCQYAFAIHDKLGNDINNPHAHIVLFDNHIKSGGRGRPSSVLGFSKKGAIEKLTETWQTIHNERMTEWGYDHRSLIDRRSYAERKIEIAPQIHEGPASKHVKIIRKNIKWGPIDNGMLRAETNYLINSINDTQRQLENEREKLGRRAKRNGENFKDFITKHRENNPGTFSSFITANINERRGAQNIIKNEGVERKHTAPSPFDYPRLANEREKAPISPWVDFWNDSNTKLYNRLLNLRSALQNEMAKIRGLRISGRAEVKTTLSRHSDRHSSQKNMVR